MATKRNLFLLGRRRDDEDQLTEMLVWLADAVPAVRSALIRLAFGRDDIDTADISVTTQYGVVGGRLDIYLTGPTFALIIESKLGSSYGEDQIGRYLRWLASRPNNHQQPALMTLTAREAPWQADDVAFAANHKIQGCARRWEELHELIAPITTESEIDSVSARVVSDFLEMLSDEGLVPIQSLTADELGPQWSDAWQVVSRYREFFRACKEPIGTALGASVAPNSWSDRGDWFWQDFIFEDGARLVVGILNTDAYERLPVAARTGEPLLWVGPVAEHLEEWRAIADWLDAHPPEGWIPGNRWYGRPTVVRRLAEVIGEGTFDEQRTRLANTSVTGRRWLDDALADSLETPRPTGL